MPKLRLPFATLALSLSAAVLSLSTAALSSGAQDPTEVRPPAARVPAAEPDDVASVDAVVAALYEVISGPAGQPRDWDRFLSLFRADARLCALQPASAGGAKVVSMTPDDYAKRSRAWLEENGFFEQEIARRTDRYGHLVHLFSTYESRRKADDVEPFARGINSIQLIESDGRWWLLTVLWQGETEDLPLPERYLPEVSTERKK